MIRTTTALSDGRPLHYYDATGGVDRRTPDRRGLPSHTGASELRYSPLLDQWVIYASHRQDRSYLPAANDCPLCPSTPERPTEIPAADYEVAVFENRFSALMPGDPADATAASALLGARPAAGRCEVVVYTPDHDAVFAELSEQRVALVLDALIDRTTELSRLPGVEQVFCFENRGREIGVTQPHPHGQIYAYPFLTPRTETALRMARAYNRRSGNNLFDDLLSAEQEAGTRIVLRSEHWTAFVPHAARWPYELHCYPNRRVPDLAALDAAALGELPGVLLDCFGRFHRLFDEPAPYIAAWHQAPVRHGRADFACHLELFTIRRTADKLKYLAGSESAMDAFASDVLPEAAAERLRRAR